MSNIRLDQNFLESKIEIDELAIKPKTGTYIDWKNKYLDKDELGLAYSYDENSNNIINAALYIGDGEHQINEGLTPIIKDYTQEINMLDNITDDILNHEDEIVNILEKQNDKIHNLEIATNIQMIIIFILVVVVTLLCRFF